MSSGRPAFEDQLAVYPTYLRECRTSIHAVSSRPAVSDQTSAELHAATADNPSSAVIIDEDKDSPTSVPILSEPPSLHIDKQSASISGYVPGTLGQGYCSTPTTPGIAAREAYFEDSYGLRSVGDEDARSPSRLKRRLAISFFEFFCTGWSDGSKCTLSYPTGY
jgi:hypothetical protein